MTTAESQTRLQMFQDSVTAGEEVKFTQTREPEANIPKQLSMPTSHTLKNNHLSQISQIETKIHWQIENN